MILAVEDAMAKHVDIFTVADVGALANVDVKLATACSWLIREITLILRSAVPLTKFYLNR